jgi:pimeloyl-ACP methyl ester carboxylesterase
MRRAAVWLGRGLLALAAVLGALAAAGATYQALASARDRRAYPAPGQLLDVGGHQLHLQCAGQGRPTVVLETGLGAWSSHWALVQPVIAGATRVCAYDRAGLGWSDPGPGPRGARRIAGELHALLRQAGVPGPYVLVGHSNGGLYARRYAGLYPDEVAGLVLLDATPADLFERLPATRADFAAARRQARTFRWLAPFGIVRLLLPRALASELARVPSPAREAIGARNAVPGQWQAMEAEVAALEASMAEVAQAAQGAQAGGLGTRPLVVLSSTVGAHTAEAAAIKLAMDAELAALSADGQHVVVEGATHLGLALNPEHARATSAAIRRVVEAARAGQPLTP